MVHKNNKNNMAADYNLTRLEVLKLAKDLLCEAYYAEHALIIQEYESKLEHEMWNVKRPELPAFPTAEDIIAKAQVLGGFVFG